MHQRGKSCESKSSLRWKWLQICWHLKMKWKFIFAQQNVFSNQDDFIGWLVDLGIRFIKNQIFLCIILILYSAISIHPQSTITAKQEGWNDKRMWIILVKYSRNSTGKEKFSMKKIQVSNLWERPTFTLLWFCYLKWFQILSKNELVHLLLIF